MSLSGSECSSGCESGWTRYLDEASNSTPFVANWKWGCGTEDQEDEDLSMVSDASSGPPPQYLYQDCAFGTANSYGYKSSVPEGNKKKGKQKKKSGAKELGKPQPSLCLDDTASSPVSHFSQCNVPCNDHKSVENVYGFSQVYSAAHQDESIPKKQLGFLKSSTKGKSGSLLGRKRQ